jgi:hypothetical protein
LAVDWEIFSEAVTTIYVLSGTWDESYRSQVINKLMSYSSPGATAGSYCVIMRVRGSLLKISNDTSRLGGIFVRLPS